MKKFFELKNTFKNKEAAEASVEKLKGIGGQNVNLLEIKDEKGDDAFAVSCNILVETPCINESKEETITLTKSELYEILNERELVVFNNFYDSFSRLYKYISETEDEVYETRHLLYKHSSEGHFPKITSVEQMDKILKLLGLDAEFKVEKKTLWVE